MDGSAAGGVDTIEQENDDIVPVGTFEGLVSGLTLQAAASQEIGPVSGDAAHPPTATNGAGDFDALQAEEFAALQEFDEMQAASNEHDLMQIETFSVVAAAAPAVNGEKDAIGEATHPPVTESVAVTDTVAVPGVGAPQIVQAPAALEAATAVITAVAGPSASAISKRSGRQQK